VPMNAFANATDVGARGAPALQSRHPRERESIAHVGNAATRLAGFRHKRTERRAGSSRCAQLSHRRHSRTPPRAPRVVLRTSAQSQGLHPLLQVGKQHFGSLPCQQLPANVGPGDDVVGSLLVVGPPTIQLSPLFRAQRQFPLSLVVGQTLPQRHRQVGPIAGREPQQLREYARFHGVILSCSIRCGKRVHDDDDDDGA